jgi:hypothetical protein
LNPAINLEICDVLELHHHNTLSAVTTNRHGEACALLPEPIDSTPVNQFLLQKISLGITPNPTRKLVYGLSLSLKEVVRQDGFVNDITTVPRVDTPQCLFNNSPEQTRVVFTRPGTIVITPPHHQE